MVFVFNGNGYGAAGPNPLTDNAAQLVHAWGGEPVQLAYPAITSTAVIDGVAREIASISQGKPIALVGFSAGGTLAERLAADPELNVKDVLACYSPPDLSDYLAYHQDDSDARFVLDHIDGNPAVIKALSGPNDTQAYVVATFGLKDDNVVAGPSTASFLADYPSGHVYDYDGGHGASIYASIPATEDFLAHM